jgi:hypothetical protein
MLIDQKMIECSPVSIQVPKSGRIVFDEMEFRGLTELWKSFLLLPMEYKIIGTFFNPLYYSWVVVIEGASFPPNKRDELLPMATPEYTISEDRKVTAHGSLIFLLNPLAKPNAIAEYSPFSYGQTGLCVGFTRN